MYLYPTESIEGKIKNNIKIISLESRKKTNTSFINRA